MIQITFMAAISNPEAFLDILKSAHYHQRFPFAQKGVRGDNGIQFASAFCTQNIDVELFTNIQLSYGLTYPALGDRYFKDSVLAVKLNVIQHMIGAVPDGCPSCQLLFRVYHFIRTVAEQELFLHIRSGTGHYQLGAQFLQQTCSLQAVLEVDRLGKSSIFTVIGV